MKNYVICYKLTQDSKKNIHFLVVNSASRIKAEKTAKTLISEPCRIITVIEGKDNG